MLVWGVEVAVASTGHLGGTRGSGIVSRAAEVLRMSGKVGLPPPPTSKGHGSG